MVYEWLLGKLSRVACRVFKLHSRYCRGREDHIPIQGHWIY